MTDRVLAADAPPRGVSPLRRLGLVMSSPWTSLTLLTVVFIHQTVGSALFFIRQWFEVNEMEWFNGWLSAVLWTVICLCLTLASLLRIPWRWSRFGAHLTHASLILMVITCSWYFAFKVEGDALLVRHYVEVTTTTGSARLLPNPGFKTAIGETAAEVEMIMPRWSVLSPERTTADKPTRETAWAIMVKVTFPDGLPFTATLIENHPELTQYTVQGRVPNSFLPQEFAAVIADAERVVVNDPAGATLLSVALSEGARTVAGERSLEITKITKDFALISPGFTGQKGTMVEWKVKGLTGQQSGSAIVGQPTLTRYQQARVKQPIDPRLRAIRLVAAPEVRAYHVDRPALWVRAATDQPARDPLQPMLSTAESVIRPLPIPHLPRYDDHGAHIDQGKPLAIDCGEAQGVRWTVTGFAPYANLAERVREDPAAPVAPCLAVTLSHPEGEPLKSYPPRLDSPEACLARPIAWLRARDDQEAERLVSLLRERFPTLTTERDDLTGEDLKGSRLMFLTRPDGRQELWMAMPGTNIQRHDVAKGKEVVVRWVDSQVRIRVENAFERPRWSSEPQPVPKEQRRSRSDVGNNYSWIQVTATSTGPNPSSRSAWVPYTHYPHVPTASAVGSRDTYFGGGYPSRPLPITMPDGGGFEVLYSRMPMTMPGDLWMTGFHVPRRPGSDSPSEFYCDVGYAEPGTPIAEARDRATIHMNHPLAWKDTFFFQSGWDPQLEAFTVLGVGNRPAGMAMLLSAMLVALGMAWSGIATATGSTRAGALAAGILAAIFAALWFLTGDSGGYIGAAPAPSGTSGVAAANVPIVSP